MKDIMTKKKAFRHMSLSNRIFYVFNSIFWIFVLIVTIYPLYFVVIASISDADAVVSGKVVLWPVDMSFVGYEYILEYKELWTAYANSLFYTVTGVLLHIVVTLAAGYVMSRRNFIGKQFINYYYLITMFFGGGLIPTFLLIRDIGLYNTRWLLIISGTFGVWSMMLARTYIQTTIPEELYEAAVLDGSSHAYYFTKVVFPLSKTIIAVLAVYNGVSRWNDYFTGLVYIRDRELLPLQTVLKEILATLQVDTSAEYMKDIYDHYDDYLEAMRVANVAKYCIMIVSTLPVMVLYMFVQKYFEKGVMIGSLKG